MFIKEFLDFNNLFKGADNFNTDIIEEENGYLIISELAGLDKSDIQIQFNEGNLIIKSNKNFESENKEYILKERGNNNHERSFYFGNKIDEKNIKAKMEDGLLFINLTFKQDLKKNITIE